MARPKYATAPVPSRKMPAGIPFIVGNEAAERFSFYGMRCILVIFMTKYLLGFDGQFDVMSKDEAKFYFHLFVASVYFLPVLGAILADVLLGKYRTILSLSVVYCLGHLALAVDETRVGLFAGLLLISLGAGGIKSCVSAHVGDQFGATNSHLLGKVFGWFYFSINLGAFASTILTPYLLNAAGFGPRWAFGVPGVLMFLATVVFWLGRWKFVHIPPGRMEFIKETFSVEGFRAVGKLCIIYAFVTMFWALFDQGGSAWVLQAEKMDRLLFGAGLQGVVEGPLGQIGLGWLASVEVLPSQIGAVNPVLILLMIPLFSYVIYPAANKIFTVTPLRKISIGLFVTVIAFSVSALIEARIEAGAAPYFIWQVLAYVILTAAEVMVSITCLEFSYTQAPKKMKSLVMGLYLLSVSAGNVFTSAVNYFIQNPDGSSKLSGPGYYWFFTGVMLVVAVGFIGVAATYRQRTYIQDEADT